MKKEIQWDQNAELAIIMAGVLIGISLIRVKRIEAKAMAEVSRRHGELAPTGATYQQDIESSRPACTAFAARR